MSTHSHTSHPPIKMGFRERWQAKCVLSPYPVQAAGFTLIELSIVLVIIGLIVGGVLVGQDLIRAAELRSVISDVEKYDAAVNTFRVKYNCLPGDCRNAANFGLRARNGGLGCGNGNKRIGSFFVADGGNAIDLQDFGGYGACGTDESQLYWADLSDTSLINHIVAPGSTGGLNVEMLLPSALNDTFFVAAHSDMNLNVASPEFGYTLIGYPKSVDQLTSFNAESFFASLNPQEAFQLDTKIDDGDPLSGKVYGLDSLPTFGQTTNKGVLANCSTDEGGGVGTYDVDTNTDNSCILKILSSAL